MGFPGAQGDREGTRLTRKRGRGGVGGAQRETERDRERKEGRRETGSEAEGGTESFRELDREERKQPRG